MGCQQKPLASLALAPCWALTSSRVRSAHTLRKWWRPPLGAAIRAAQWGGREKTGAPTRLFLGLVARALSAPPLALGIFPSSGCSFLPGRGVAPDVAGARRVPLAGSVSSAPPPSTARGGVVGRSGPFRAGRPVAGASRLPNPLWCGLVLGPSLFRCAGRCRSPLRRLWIAAQPVIEIFSSGGGARLLLRPWAGGAVLPRSFCLPPGPQWVTRLRCGEGWWWSSAPAPGVRLAPCRDAPAPSVARARPNAGGSARPPGAGAFCVYGIQGANSNLRKLEVLNPHRNPRVGGTAQGAGFPL